MFQIIPNEGARAISLEKGDIDFIPYHAMPLGEVDRLKESKNVTVAFQKRVIAGQYQAFVNTREGPLAKKEVRQALYAAMNRPDMLEKAGFGFGKVSREDRSRPSSRSSTRRTSRNIPMIPRGRRSCSTRPAIRGKRTASASRCG